MRKLFQGSTDSDIISSDLVRIATEATGLPRKSVDRAKWKPGFVHGDPFEERVVVLGQDTLPAVERKVTIGPHNVELRKFFLARLERAVASTTVGESVLVMVFAHGDFSHGGLVLGGDPETVDQEKTLKPSDITNVLAKYPDVKITCSWHHVTLVIGLRRPNSKDKR
jgi:hypothetical protein